MQQVPLANTNVPPPRVMGAVPLMQAPIMTAPPPMMSATSRNQYRQAAPMQFRQPTNVIYFDADTQPPQKLAPRERHCLDFKAPSN